VHGGRHGHCSGQVQNERPERVSTPATWAASGSNVISRNRYLKTACTLTTPLR
jgi:hypothetical protein